MKNVPPVYIVHLITVTTIAAVPKSMYVCLVCGPAIGIIVHHQILVHLDMETAIVIPSARQGSFVSIILAMIGNAMITMLMSVVWIMSLPAEVVREAVSVMLATVTHLAPALVVKVNVQLMPTATPPWFAGQTPITPVPVEWMP
jgi:hypothetical protein